MEVVNSNFKEKLPEVLNAIEEAEFLAIDGEMTGVNGQVVESEWDKPADRYEKLRQGAADYLLCQLGLACFKLDEESKRYVTKSFKFYLFPRNFPRLKYEPKFLCQASSLHFLIENGFDFNKLFKEGIPYLSFADEELLQQRLNARRSYASRAAKGGNAGAPAKRTEVQAAHEGFVKEVRSQIERLLEEGGGEHVKLAPCTPYQRKLVYEMTELDYNGVLCQLSGEGASRSLVIRRANQEEIDKKKEEKNSFEENELSKLAEFSKVVKAISTSGKLVVGHNMLLDLLQFASTFFGPLPSTYEEFKEVVKCLLPRVIDTKVMASQAPIKENIPKTVLSELHKSIQEKPFIAPPVVVAEGFPDFSTEAYHDAAYDAYVTGYCFISMTNYFGKFKTPTARHVSISDPIVQAYINKVHLGRSNDIPYFSLTGSDIDPDRSHVFHVEFPEEWRDVNIKKVFARCGTFAISWQSSTTAFVVLADQKPVDDVMTLIERNTACRVLPYGHWYETERGRHRCGSAILSTSEAAKSEDSPLTGSAQGSDPVLEAAPGELASDKPGGADGDDADDNSSLSDGEVAGVGQETSHISSTAEPERDGVAPQSCPTLFASPPSKKRRQAAAAAEAGAAVPSADMKSDSSSRQLFEEPDW